LRCHGVQDEEARSYLSLKKLELVLSVWSGISEGPAGGHREMGS
jgi:hypothetical protein